MRQKLILIFIGFCGFAIMISFLQSCDLMKYDATICDIEFTGINQSLSEPDYLTEKIGFVIRSVNNCPSALNLNRLNLISSCYATTKCAEWQNALLESSYELRLDRQIILENDTILPNTDLLHVEKLKVGIKISTENDCKFIISTIDFSDEIREKLNVETGIYNVTFNCRTTDGKEFEKQRKVILKNENDRLLIQ